jgi:predicted  nucleic acid-binding Zn-ribbon protein
MTRKNVERWQCNDCGEIYDDPELLTAPNPFDDSLIIVGCPNCKSVGDFMEICDEPNCNRPASCGFPTPDGYRRTCGDHMREFDPDEKKG